MVAGRIPDEIVLHTSDERSGGDFLAAGAGQQQDGLAAEGVHEIERGAV